MTPRKPFWALQYWAHCENQECSFHLKRFSYRLERFDKTDFCFNCGQRLWKMCEKCGTTVINPRGEDSRFCENCGNSHFKAEK